MYFYFLGRQIRALRYKSSCRIVSRKAPRSALRAFPFNPGRDFGKSYIGVMVEGGFPTLRLVAWA
jgi:hypothetical protein